MRLNGVVLESEICLQLVLVLYDRVSLDAPNEAVFRYPFMLVLYNHCKTSRSIFERSCECTCAVMHAADMPL